MSWHNTPALFQAVTDPSKHWHCPKCNSVEDPALHWHCDQCTSILPLAEKEKHYEIAHTAVRITQEKLNLCIFIHTLGQSFQQSNTRLSCPYDHTQIPCACGARFELAALEVHKEFDCPLIRVECKVMIIILKVVCKQMFTFLHIHHGYVLMNMLAVLSKRISEKQAGTAYG